MKEFAHPGTDEKIPIDLNHAIETVIAVARNEWKYTAEVVTEFDPELPPVPGLAGELNQVFLNLLVNAGTRFKPLLVPRAARARSHSPLAWWQMLRKCASRTPAAASRKRFVGESSTRSSRPSPSGRGPGRGLPSRTPPS